MCATYCTHKRSDMAINMRWEMPVLWVVFWMRLLFILLSGNEREKCGTGWMTWRKKVIMSLERKQIYLKGGGTH